MAFELITGHAGRNHVDSADMGEAFAGIVGKGRYILDTGEGMACSMTDSNTLTVGTGSMLMDGRIVRNETAATFRIANGTQGQYRHDLACLRYTLDRSNDSIESVEQVVLQGTPATTASEAKDPEYKAGDILSGDLSATVPIARVKLDNLTPTCEAMLGSVTSLKSLGDFVSQTKTFLLTSPCMRSRGNSDTPVVLKVCGNVCTLYVNGMTTKNIENYAALLDSTSLKVLSDYIPREFDSEQQRNVVGETKPVGCRLTGSGPNLWLSKDSTLGKDSEMRFVFSWVR